MFHTSSPSSKKMKHQLTHIPFQPWCTPCVKDKAQTEPHKRTERIVEQERPYGRAPCPNRRWSLYMREVYDDSQSTAGQKRTTKSVTETPQKPRLTTTDDAADPRASNQKYMNTRTRMRKRTTTMVRTRNHPTSQTTRIMASGGGDNFDVEPDRPKREAHRNTRECVREKAADDEITKATDHTCPTS